MKCGACGGDHVVHETRDVERDYRGATLLIKGVSGKFCPDCGEVTMTRAESVVYMAKLKEARAAINEGAHEAVLLESVRKKLGMTRKAAGEAFGGGVNAFSRYETGKTAAPKPLIQLFTLLNRHPGLAYELNLPIATLPSESFESFVNIDALQEAVRNNSELFAQVDLFDKGVTEALKNTPGFYGGSSAIAPVVGFNLESVMSKLRGAKKLGGQSIPLQPSHLRHG